MTNRPPTATLSVSHELDEAVQTCPRARNLTDDFSKVSEAELLAALEADPRTLIVFRLILGYTIAELASALELLNVAGATRATIDALEHGRGTVTVLKTHNAMTGSARCWTRSMRK